MKVVLIDQATLQPAAISSQLASSLVATDQQYLLQLVQQFNALGIPVMFAELLVTPEAVASTTFNRHQATQVYGSLDALTSAGLDLEESVTKAEYFHTLYRILSHAHNQDWLEANFNAELPVDLSTSYKLCRWQALQDFNQLLDEQDKLPASLWQELAEEVVSPTATGEALARAVASLAPTDQAQFQANLADNVAQLDLRVRKDEWILVLDRHAILHPQFFAKLKYFMSLKLSPEVLDLSDPQLEQALTQQLLRTDVSSSDLAQWLAQQQQRALDYDLEQSYLTSQAMVATTWLGINPNELGIKLRANPEISGVRKVSATSSATTDKNQASLLLPADSQQRLNLWTDELVTQFEYKRAYHRYNEKLQCYFFVKHQGGSFGTSAFLIRASAIKKIVASKLLGHFANNVFYQGDKLLDTAYVRGCWAVAPSAVDPLPLTTSKHPVMQVFERWNRGLGCYVRQLKLTASLDSNEV